MKSVETSEGCGRQGKRRERANKAQQDNSQVPPLKDPGSQVLTSTKVHPLKDLGRQVLISTKVQVHPSKDPGSQVLTSTKVPPLKDPGSQVLISTKVHPLKDPGSQVLISTKVPLKTKLLRPSKKTFRYFFLTQDLKFKSTSLYSLTDLQFWC